MSQGRLAGKVAIVTGAGSVDEGVGIGAAIAIAFAREGAAICLVDLSRERAEATLAQVEQAGGEAQVVDVDVTDDEDCARVVRATVDRFGHIDTLVNNVGIASAGAGFDPHSPEAFSRVMDVNLKSVLLMSRHAVPAMESGGSIVNMSSIAGLRVSGGGSGYGPSKAALNMLTCELAVDHGRQGIRANAIAPGHVYTPLVAADTTPEARDLRRRLAPLGIEGTAWDVAHAAVFLASDDSRFVTGTCLPVDGGITAVGVLRGYRMADEA